MAHVDKGSQSEHYNDAKRGEALVIKRTLVNEEKEPGQRNSLFHTGCKSQNKYRDVVIDSGITDNLVSEEMVTKLKLKRERHP